MIKAFLFDLDGTLVASEALKGLALAEACQHYGGSVDPMIYAEVMGEDWPTVTGHFFEQANISPDYNEFNQHFRECYIHLLDTKSILTPGAVELIAYAKHHGIKIGLVSSAASWMVEKLLAKHNLATAFDLVITHDQVSKHKPDPEAYMLALSQLHLPPAEVLVFEDSLAGLKAASGAGCRCIAIKHAYNTSHDTSLAERAISDFIEFLDPNSFRS